MAMTLRLTEDEQTALREYAEAEGISMQEVARRAVRDYVARGRHRERVSRAATRGSSQQLASSPALSILSRALYRVPCAVSLRAPSRSLISLAIEKP